MWVVMKVIDFEIESTNCPWPFTFDAGKLKGYLPVYENLGDAKTDYPGANYYEIEKVEHGTDIREG